MNRSIQDLTARVPIVSQLNWRRIFEGAAVILFSLLIGWRAFGRQPIGLADNGDFPKILGRIKAWPKEGRNGHEFRYLVTDYVIEPGGRWDSHLPSVELWVAKLARLAGKPFLGPQRFDLRFVGAIHALFLIASVWILVHALRGLNWTWSFALTALILAMFADLEYLEFLNTAFMDAGSIFALVLLSSFAIALTRQGGETNWKLAAGFGGSAAWFLGTKIQHQPTLIPLLLFCAYFLFKAKLRAARSAWAATLILLISTSVYMERHMPWDYEAESLFSLTFLKLVPLSHSPVEALRELGRPASDAQYVSMHAWSAGTPLVNSRYRDRFWRSVTHRRVALFYLRHPKLAWIILSSDLRKAGADVPISEITIGLDPRTFTRYGLLRKADNPIPSTRPAMFDPWSTSRRWLATRLPWAVPMLYAICLIAGLRRISRPRGEIDCWPLILLLCAIGAWSFVVGSLADATDTSRHIVTYQVSTDLILLSLAFQLAYAASRGRLLFQRNKPVGRSAES